VRSSEPSRYQVPAPGAHLTETTVRRSRFLTELARAATPQAAKDFVTSVRAERPDATHHCWAFVAGPPGSTAQIGMSDDGEPHGTAGRPILNVLLHSGVGDVVAVVTRYFGGVKLGTGGLARAYAGSAAEALATLPTVEKVELVRVRVTIPFASLDGVHRALGALGAAETDATYGEDATLDAALAPESVDELADQVAAITAGRGSVEIV
jgi:uncharacterized YigZ family protein